MTRILSKVAMAGLLALGMASKLFAQAFWDPICIDPTNTNPYSNDYLTYYIEDDLFGAALGIDGTVAYGTACFDPALTVDVTGRIGFSIGPVGSNQDDYINDQQDNYLRLNFGMPFSPGATWGYAMTVQPSGARTLFGANEMTLAFVGASDRYMFAESTNDGVAVRCQIDIIGDSARVAWTMQSTDATAQRRGLWFGQWVTMLTADGTARPSWFVTVPGRRPLRTDQVFNRTTDPQGFPTYANFGMTQKDAFGLQVLNGPNETTTDANGLNSDQTEVDEFIVGKNYLMLNGPNSNTATFPGLTIPDTLFVPNDGTDFGFDLTAYIQKFPLRDVPSNAVPRDSVAPQFVAYYRSTTGVSNYARPYSVVVDSPKLIQTQDTDPNQFLPNPSQIRVYVDNTRGFSTIDKEIDLNDVKVTLSLPDGMFVYNAAEVDPLNPTNPQRTAIKYIDTVASRRIAYVDFTVGTGKNAFGSLGYQVKVEPTPGITKTILGSITVASQPRLLIRGTEGGITGANLVAVPWNFSSSNWETILSAEQTMRLDQDFRAFTFDPQLQAYIVQTGPERNRGTWILSKKELGYTRLGANPTQPTDLKTGAPNLNLKSGWNLIGNPYNYSFPIQQIVGVSAQDGTQSYTFQELVNQGVVSGSLAYWDQDTQSYKYVDVTDRLQPNRGYWIFVVTPQDLTLRFPPVFDPFLRSAPKAAWTQSDRKWRLQLVARTEKALDDQNYVGIAPSQKEAKALEVVKPPVAPIDGAVSVSIAKESEGKTRSLASDFRETSGRQEWSMNVFSKEAGSVTVTWPNLSSLPKNVKLRLTDLATGSTRDMRRNSGYSFTTEKTSTTRVFKIQAEPGTSSRATIGSVLVSRVGRDRNSPISINYTLTTDATTSVRILRTDGREVYAPSRGRAERAGANTVTWNLRDSANRAVPPGTYKVEILAESADGERVRKIVVVNVIR